jgi:hypothetical protein
MTEIFIPRFSNNPPLEGYGRCCGNTEDPRLMSKDNYKFMLSAMVHSMGYEYNSDDGIIHQNDWLKDKIIGPALADIEGMVSVWSKGNIEDENGWYDEKGKELVRRWQWKFMFQVGRKGKPNE